MNASKNRFIAGICTAVQMSKASRLDHQFRLKKAKSSMNAPIHDRPLISLISHGLGPDEVSLFIGGSDGASDLQLLREHNITTVVNCAVNLDINYVDEANTLTKPGKRPAGPGAVRTYKVGLIDGDGNPGSMMLAGYYILDGALRQVMPDKPSYPRRDRGNVLVHCRGGRSRSVALVALFLHLQQQDIHPTLQSAIDHIRKMRDLHPDEWFETPKPTLINAAQFAADAVKLLESEK